MALVSDADGKTPPSHKGVSPPLYGVLGVGVGASLFFSHVTIL